LPVSDRLCWRIRRKQFSLVIVNRSPSDEQRVLCDRGPGARERGCREKVKPPDETEQKREEKKRERDRETEAREEEKKKNSHRGQRGETPGVEMKRQRGSRAEE